MKRLALATLSMFTLAVAAPAFALTPRFDDARQDTVNRLNDRFDDARGTVVNRLSDRFRDAHQDNLNRS